MTTDQWDDSVAGKRLRLVVCTDEHTRLEPGTEGTARFVDAIGTLHVDWDGGSKLGLCPEAGDRWTWL